VLHPPQVARIDVHYEFPAPLGLSPVTENSGGDVYGPAGTRVRLEIEADKPVESGALVLDDGTRIELSADGSAVLAGEMTIDSDGSYRVALADLDGLASDGDTEYFIRVLEDRPPVVRVERPAGDLSVTPVEEVSVLATAEDDYGIERFELVYSVGGGEEKTLSLGDGRRQFVEGQGIIHLEELDVEPGDFVAYHVRASDGRRGGETRSDIFFLEVRPFSGEFTAAASQATAGGGGGGGGSLESLVKAQKDIIIATWKLDRPVPSPSSLQKEDIRAVARAQGELRSRAQQAAGASMPSLGGRRSGWPPRPGVVPRDTDSESALAQAARAMATAETELEALKPGRALPHEKEALAHLLKAQAENRQRQVARQQAGGAGGGGYGRSGEDLSALFDRELQRHQQTSYEVPNSGETRPENEANDALDKLRELARRQGELDREQRELQEQRASMSPEELKRQLQRLTREQSELRRRAEELSRQMGRQAQASGRGSSGAQQDRAGDQMRDVSEEMQNAANELRREDLAGASARGRRALETLRELERQLQADRPEERQRAIGDTQLEARQLAELQRRMAERMGEIGERPIDADARRRLAGEKDAIADRVGRLERDVKRLAESGGRQDPALGSASEELERQRVRERMRETAERLRADGQQEPTGLPAGLAESERDLARALERVADGLSVASRGDDEDSRRLSERLARTRELRDELSEIGRELRRLEGSSPEQRGERSGEQSRDSQQARQGRGQEGRQSGQGEESGRRQQSGQTGQGEESGRGQQRGQAGTSGEAGVGGDAASALREELARRIREAEQLLRDSGARDVGRGGAGITPEGQGMVRSAPGTEWFKQDFSDWEELRRDVTLSLEQTELALSQQLRDRRSKDRVAAGTEDQAPEAYRREVEQYFRMLAERKKRSRN
jgi:hypothetical protein